MQLAEGPAPAKFIRIERVLPAAREGQLARDSETLLALQLEGFAGKTWEQTAGDLFHYGQRVLPAKIRSGEIFHIMKEVGVPPAKDLCLPGPPELTPEDCEELAQDVMGTALPAFKLLLMQGAWDPAHESAATMRTYFIGKCALDFRRPWRSWLRSRARRLRTEDCGVNWDRLAELPARLGHPEAAALAGLELRSTLNQLSGDTREVVMLDACGFGYQQIAKRLGLSPKAVEYRLSKARKQLRLIREKRRLTA